MLFYRIECWNDDVSQWERLEEGYWNTLPEAIEYGKAEVFGVWRVVMNVVVHVEEG